MATLNVIKVNGGFVPATKEAVEEFKKIPLKAFLEVKYHIPRNYNFLKKYFAMLTKVAYNLDVDEDILHTYIKEQLGEYTIVSLNGKILKQYHSISFNKMDEVEFAKYYDKSIEVLAELLGNNKQELLAEFE